MMRNHLANDVLMCSNLSITWNFSFRKWYLAKRRNCLMWKYSAYFTTKDGRRIYARQRGRKVFRFWVEDPEPKDHSA
nr:MAG TPA: hypothetical protein [Caudoviricetes sp.]